MKLIFISDTHSYLDKVKIPYGDILVHCGDLTSCADYWEVSKLKNDFLEILNNGLVNDIVYIAGNHDKMFDKNKSEALKIMQHKRMHYLEESSITLGGVKFWGSPYTPEFFNWYFMYNRDKESGKNRWKDIPKDADVIVCHGPVHGKLDDVQPYAQYHDPHSGCPYLLEKVLEIKPKIFAHGHIHGSRGFVRGVNTTFINASICTESYAPINKPIIVDTESWDIIDS